MSGMFVPRALSAFAFLLLGLMPGVSLAVTVQVYPAPKGEELSTDYTVQVEGQDTPVYVAKVSPADQKARWKGMDDKQNSADFFEKASFTTFDFEGTVRIQITCPEAVRSAKVLPASYGIQPSIHGKLISLQLDKPRPLTIEINDTWVGALHIFGNPPEINVPRPDDPHVIFYGPGIHEVGSLTVPSGKTVYVAGGAIVRGVIKPDEKFHVSSYSGLKTYAPTFTLKGEKIVFRGRGIVDGSHCTTHARNLLVVRGQDIQIEGVILRDSSTWTIPIRQCDRVTVKNVKLLGYRANSDGIDICNSRDVTVDGCFIRTLDDLIVVKSDQGQGEVRKVVAKNCVLWNEVAHALSVGAELRENVDDVLFTDCDIIHDLGREWTLRVYHCDSARISNIRFENIRIEETKRLISLWIGKAVWTRDEARGHIDGVVFKDIRVVGKDPRLEFTGFSEANVIENVTLTNVVVNGKSLKQAEIKSNAFVRNVKLLP
ncbi:MAG: glycosyl hydrolase family 28 protein [Planctomycetota bacterium]|nr:glycosyl hydrolase family 28 protein [Planctomycetota bacterium]